MEYASITLNPLAPFAYNANFDEVVEMGGQTRTSLLRVNYMSRKYFQMILIKIYPRTFLPGRLLVPQMLLKMNKMEKEKSYSFCHL